MTKRDVTRGQTPGHESPRHVPTPDRQREPRVGGRWAEASFERDTAARDTSRGQTPGRVLFVPVPDPFDFALSTERFRAFGADPVNVWDEGTLYRVLDETEVAIAPAPGGVVVAPPAPRLAGRVLRFLGGAFDLDSLARFAATSDPVLDRIQASLRGLRPVLVPDPLEMLVGSITAQQVSLHAATAIRARLVRRLGVRGRHAHAFPSRERLATASPDDLTALGFSRRKAHSVLALARSDLDLHALAALPDEEVAARLTSLPGLGRWTADWFLARHLGRPHAWPAGDLGLRKAVAAFYGLEPDASEKQVRAFGERFGAHRNLATHYLLVALRVLAR